MKKYIISFLVLIAITNIGLHGQQLHRAGLLFEDVSKNPSIRKAEPKKVLYKLATSVDNSAHLPPIGNQGQQGSCVAWAIGYYYKTYQEWQEHGWSVTDPNHIFSPSFIYNNIDGGMDGGSYFSDALKLLVDNGCASIAEFPYQGDYTLLPKESVYLDAMQYRSLDAYYIQTNDMAGIEQVKQLLANGNVAVLGIIIRGNFDNINNYNDTYCVKDTMGNNRGGHALTLVGYDDNKITGDGIGAFRLVNQWGSNWGDSGFCWMSYHAVMDPAISQGIVCYTTDRINYKPSIIASIQITHSNMNLLKLNFGIGINTAPKYAIDYFNFYMNTLPGIPARAFPGNKIDFDLSDGLTYIDTSQSNNIFLKTQSTVPGTVNNFSITDLRVAYTTTSTETPKTIPDNNQIVFTNIDLKIVNESNIASTNIALLQGWNLVSVPVIAADMSTGVLFAKANSPTYNYTNKYNTITTLENGSGYWIRYPDADTINITGRIVNSNTIPVTEGWNLIGGYDKNININQITTTPWGIINSPFYEYTNKYEVPTVMEAGKSYWVRVSGDGVINIGNALAKNANQTIAQGNINSKWIKVIVRDNKGNQSTVYGTTETINFEEYALPPLPPSGVFDVRWDSDQFVDNISNGTKDILIHSAEYPVTLKVEGGELNIKDKIGGTFINTIVKDGQRIVITNSGINGLQIKTVEIPTKYELSQNYPNPFNPTTTINYSVPKTSFVTIKVYDVLGREVANLLNEEKVPGNYKVEFNASKLASGIYFYRMLAGSFVETRKLILLK